jgi:hypothetical protein
MTASTTSGFTVAELARLLGQADPAALLVPPRILRRVIKQDRGLTGVGLQVPHRKSYAIDRDALLRIAARDELGLAADGELPEAVLLFPLPEEHQLRRLGRGAALVEYWRLLFHARVHVALAERLGGGRLTEAGVRERMQRIGAVVCDEILAVLRQEHFLLPPGDRREVYQEFAALYLELRFFAPHLLPRYFPAILQFDDVDRVLAEDVDAEALFARTRPEGAPDPLVLAETPEGEEAGTEPYSLVPTGEAPEVPLARADRASRKGNVVRAAILRMRAARSLPEPQAAAMRRGAEGELGRLVRRLQQALKLSDAEALIWLEALAPLLEPASRWLWPAEARLLYDLQKVCIDSEREVYAVDLVEWVVTWGRQPVKRQLPNQRPVLMVKHLRRAAHRLAAVRLPQYARLQLEAFLGTAIDHTEGQLRLRFGPLVTAALDEVGLRPGNCAETVARDKLVEELLDRVVERGFLTMGDLRDAMARNRLKLPDLGSRVGSRHAGPPASGLWQRLWLFLTALVAVPWEMLRGDSLIKANRLLAIRLDGVYRRGEIYLRWLQRLSSLAFGTRLGRWLTLYLVLPFGGAFLVLEGLNHIVVHPVQHFLDPWVASRRSAATAIGLLMGADGLGPSLAAVGVATLPERFSLLNRSSLLATGLFFLATLHIPWFRRLVVRSLGLLGKGLRSVVFDLPGAVLRLPPVPAILNSKTYLLFYQFVVKPLVWAAPVTLVLLLLGCGPLWSLGEGAAVFAVASVLLHSRLGQHIEEVCTDGLVRTYYLLREDVLPGLFRAVVFLFKRLLETIERLLYTVDEWLRFRTGDNRAWLAVKPVLGLVWFVVTYVLRFCINLLIEPQINPIKHFPVVTVSHKLVITLGVPYIAKALQLTFGMKEAESVALAITVGSLIPGIFGFLVWELKENWRLYRANQPPTLRPQVVGHHGETVLRLMRPGFHSGTLPKLYARLRRNERHREGRAAHKQREALHQVRESLHHFVERDLVAVLAHSKSWGADTRLHVGEIRAGTNRIRVELCCPGLARESVYLDFEEHAGRLLAGMTSNPPGQPARGTWLAGLRDDQARALADALAGFYHLAGVDLVREQLEALLPSGMPWAVTEEGLLVWPAKEYATEAVYDLEEGPELAPRPLVGPLAPELPVLEGGQVFYGETPVGWNEWVETWERDRAGKGHDPLLVPGVQLLPGRR